MPFGLRARVGSRNHVLDGGPDPPWEGALLGERGALCKVYGLFALNCAKTAEPIEMPFGMLTWVDPRNHVLDEVQIPTGRGNFEEEGHAPTCPTTL